MANLTSAGVTIVRSWTETTITGKGRIGMIARIAAGTFGDPAGTNKIVPSAFGLTVFESCSPAANAAGDTVYLAVVNGNQNAIGLVDLTVATDAQRLPADITFVTAITLEIHGY